MEKIVKNACKKEVVYFCIVLLITKCVQAEIKGDEKLQIDLEWSYNIIILTFFILTIINPFKAFNAGVCDNRNSNECYNYDTDDGNQQGIHFFTYCRNELTFKYAYYCM